VESDRKLAPTDDYDASDLENFGRIYEVQFRRIYNYIRYRVRNAAVADDLTSQTFHKALTRLMSYDPSRATMDTWLLVIARHTVSDHLRAQKRRRILLLGWRQDGINGPLDPEAILIDAQERDRLLAAIATLHDRERDLLGLKFATGSTNRTIADLTGYSESNVGVIVHRAVAKLRASLEPERKQP
jgi:RNA polymerase sigma-70 factor (ECF subfamily)